MKDHPKFGMQFHATHFRKDIPQTKQGVISYLSSEIFKGIGKKTAEKIVETLGNNAITKILNQPSLLDSVPKLPSEKAKDLYETLMEHQGLRTSDDCFKSIWIWSAIIDENFSGLQRNDP